MEHDKCHLGHLVENEVSPCSGGKAVGQHSQCMLCFKKLHASILSVGNRKKGLIAFILGQRLCGAMWSSVPGCHVCSCNAT